MTNHRCQPVEGVLASVECPTVASVIEYADIIIIAAKSSVESCCAQQEKNPVEVWDLQRH